MLPVGLGVVLLVTLLVALTSGDGSGYLGSSDPGSDDTGSDDTGSDDTGSGAGGSGGGTSFYDGGSITTTEDGELIYSDTAGNGFSTGG
ncbi:hypothetical protein [Pseudonocardia humida]|uniref:Uncharacterized protein n=1 Tax=Pseudonocardia humida TaxID=2800819 RepID=A0ABT1A738_9PSEU|nr:hypothetical protein [Pseudonocardia humida]MCO1658847.1 hypothetical protein [Pseudonocardia humida]